MSTISIPQCFDGGSQNPLSKLEKSIEELNAKYFSIITIPSLYSVEDSVLVHSNWNKCTKVDESIFQPRWLEDLIIQTKKTVLPFDWTLLPSTDVTRSDLDKYEIDRLIDQGVFNGICIPVHGPFGKVGLLFIGKLKGDVGQNKLEEIQLLALATFEMLYERQRGQKRETYLRKRERDCLQWVANGKTSYEISIILGISEHTVNNYINSASNRLNATNRPQAVARALQAGLINLEK